MPIIFVTSLLLVGPASCSRADVSEAFGEGKYARAESIALQCSKEDPIYFFLAAQAQGELRKWAAQRKSLKSFLAQVGSGDPNRAEAKAMLGRCEKELARTQAPTPKNPPPPGQPADREPTAKPGDESATVAPPPEKQDPGPDDATPTPEGPDPEVGRPDPRPDDGADSGNEEPGKRPPRDPRRRGLWLGVGIVGGTSVLAGATTSLFGYLKYTDRARHRNEEELASAGLSSDFDGTATDPGQVMKLEEVEGEYPSRTYYRELRLGIEREGVGTAVATAGVGLVVGALPELARDERRRRIGLGVTIAAGAAVLAAGAVLTNRFYQSTDDLLGGRDATAPDGWRAGGVEYYDQRRNYLLSTSLTGLGVGLFVGSAVTAAIRWRDKPGQRDTRARLRLVPTLGGAALAGRF